MKEITDLEELKKIELNIMKKIHKFCIEHDIKYCLSCGTLIGAVRHKGFIPWDDDIDIIMSRPEYEKFIAIFPKYQEELGLELVNHQTPTRYMRLLSKVIDTTTVLYETEYRTDDPIGVFVDIWPLDGMPKGKIKSCIYQYYSLFWKKLLLATSMKTSNEYGIGKNLTITMAHIFEPEKVMKKLEKISRKYDFQHSDYVKSYMGMVIYNKEDFEKLILADFETEKFYIPKNYDRILKMAYGDYMKYPPKEQQIPHHVMDVYYR